jgi:hypothetical protein
VLDPPPKRSSDITTNRVQRFILHPDRPGLGDARNILRLELLRWHPDKFTTWVLSQVAPEHVSEVEDGLHSVSSIIAELKANKAGLASILDPQVCRVHITAAYRPAYPFSVEQCFFQIKDLGI